MNEPIYSESDRSEASIIVMAQAGNSDAFGELYQLHMDAISRYIQRRVNEIDEVENLTQTVFIKAWQAIARYQPTKAPFRAWLYRIAGNTVIDYYRTRKETVDLETQWALADAGRSPEEMAVVAERDESVRTAIDSLRPSYQQIISLRFLDEQDYPETAQALGRQVNAVRVLQHRALGAMRKVLSEEQIFWLVGAAAALTVALGGGVAVAAEGALPGDLLYPVKRVVESSRLSIADDERDVELYLTFMDRRVDELARLAAAGRGEEMAASAGYYVAHVADALATMSMLADAESERSQELADRLSTTLSAQTERLTSLASEGADALLHAVDIAAEARTAVEDLRAPPPDEPPSEPADPGNVQPLNATDHLPALAGPMAPAAREHFLRDGDRPSGSDAEPVQADVAVDGARAESSITMSMLPINADTLDGFPEPQMAETPPRLPAPVPQGDQAPGTGPRLDPGVAQEQQDGVVQGRQEARTDADGHSPSGAPADRRSAEDIRPTAHAGAQTPSDEAGATDRRREDGLRGGVPGEQPESTPERQPQSMSNMHPTERRASSSVLNDGDGAISIPPLPAISASAFGPPQPVQDDGSDQAEAIGNADVSADERSDHAGPDAQAESAPSLAETHSHEAPIEQDAHTARPDRSESDRAAPSDSDVPPAHVDGDEPSDGDGHSADGPREAATDVPVDQALRDDEPARDSTEGQSDSPATDRTPDRPSRTAEEKSPPPKR